MSIRALTSELRSLLEGVEMRSPSADEVTELRKFARSVYKGISVKQHKTVDGVRAEIRGPYKDDKFTEPGKAYQKIVQWLVANGWVQWPEGSADGLRKQAGHAIQYDAFYDIGLLMKAA